MAGTLTTGGAGVGIGISTVIDLMAVYALQFAVPDPLHALTLYPYTPLGLVLTTLLLVPE
ncbi:hypothetical protein N9L66_05135 [Porticoccaceae bacterium]|nr:hypothetical protein [Porticoccaceae bacterium]